MSKPENYEAEAETTVLTEVAAEEPKAPKKEKKEKKNKEKKNKDKKSKDKKSKENDGEIRYHKKKRTWKERLSANLFVGPSFIGVMIFFIVPSFVVLYYANIDSIIGKNFVGFKNFSSVLSNSSFQAAAKNTVKLR